MLDGLMTYLSVYVGNKKGQGMVEYALIIGLVAIVVIAVLVLLGPQINVLFTKIIDALKGV